MRASRFLRGIFLLPLCSCNDHRFDAVVDPLAATSRIAKADLAVFDVTQSTCALYVAVRSGALDGPIAFGRDLEDLGIHWNKCPGGTMVACVVAPTAHGDSVITGIPFPY
ncbi:MAG TPA: hypothetical protein VGE21_11285 [Flavobacteriales bacterium]